MRIKECKPMNSRNPYTANFECILFADQQAADQDPHKRIM